MKKLLAILLAALMALTLAACGNETNPDTPAVDTPEDTDDNVVNEPVADEVENCTEVLNTIWELYTDDEKFPAMGGDFDNTVDSAPGTYSLADAEATSHTFKIPADTIALTNDCASIMHMMNANTFTCAVFHVTDSANVQTVCDNAKNAVAEVQWMCGFPDKHLVTVIDNSYVLSAFGNIDLMNTLRDKISASGYSVSEAYWVDVE